MLHPKVQILFRVRIYLDLWHSGKYFYINCMLPGLVIWKTTHAQKMWSTNSLLCLWLPSSCWQKKTCAKKNRNAVYWTLRRLSRICHKSPVGINEWAVLCKITSNSCGMSVLCWNRVKYSLLIYFCGLCKPWNYFRTKISWGLTTVKLI